MTLELRPQDIDRFWSKVQKGGGCWEWQAATDDGYGKMWLHNQMESAHRISFTIANGVIPDDRLVDHACLNHSCVRPDHLRLATSKQNNENLAGPYKNNTSGVRGVSWDKKNAKWSAHVGHNKRLYRVGRFDTLEEATTAVIAKRLELFTHNELDRNGN